MKLAIKRIEDNVAFTSHSATAWYLLAPQRWNWRQPSEQDALINATAQRIASLVGRRLHIRVTTRNMTPQGWRNRLNRTTANPLPDFDGYLDHTVEHLSGIGVNLSERVAFLGVELKRPTTHFLGALWPTKLEMLQLQEELDEVTDIVRRPGLSGIPVKREQLEWLIHRSVALGCPAPGIGDIDEACDRADFFPNQWGHSRSVRVEAEIGGEPFTRHGIIMTVGRMATLNTDSSSFYPWMALLAQLPFAVEIAGTVDVLPSTVPIKAAKKALLRVRSTWDHFVNDHKLHPPHSLEVAQERAVEVQAEMETGFGNLSTRTHGWFRIGVLAKTADIAKVRAKRVEELFQPHITVARPLGQVALAKEFIPGERLSSTAYKRIMPVKKLGGAQPAATATVGHRQGMYAGYTRGAGGKHAVFWDAWQSQEGRGRRGSRSGVTLIAGGLGAGKSWLEGRIIYDAVMSGIPSVVLDPSGPLGRLPFIPELAPYSQHIDLFDAQDGILNIWRIIQDPPRSMFPPNPVGTKIWRQAIAKAQALRWTVLTDALITMLPASMALHPDTTAAIMSACQAVESERKPSPTHVLRMLREGIYTDDEEVVRQGRKVLSVLDPISKTATGRLIFPSGVREIDYIHDEAHNLLKVITMRGARFPKEGKDRQYWTLQERQSMAVLNLAIPLVFQPLYMGDRNQRKLAAVDEVVHSVRTDSGKDMIEDACLESRKNDMRVLLSSQNVSHSLAAGIANWVDNVFAGRTENEDDQLDLLKVMGVSTEVGYERVLGNLSEEEGIKEFLMTDGMGGCEVVVIDKDSVPTHVQEAFETTPDEGMVGVA